LKTQAGPRNGMTQRNSKSKINNFGLQEALIKESSPDEYTLHASPNRNKLQS